MKESTIALIGGSVAGSLRRGKADILIRDGRIAAVGAFDVPQGAAVLDARSRWILPGGVDAHVHLAMRAGCLITCDDFVSGTQAALRGGTTGVVDFVEPERGQPLDEALDARLAEAAGAAAPVKLHMTVSEWRDGTAGEMEACVKRGIAGFKVYLAYLDSIGVDAGTFMKIMERARDLGAKVLVHAEDGRSVDALRAAFVSAGRLGTAYHAMSRPAECEAAAIAAVVQAVRRLGGPRTVIAHVSSAAGLRELLAGKDEGLPIYAETCPHYLAFDAGQYGNPSTEAAARFVMSPPLRSREDSEFLWKSVADGGIDFIATDHCPFPAAAKDAAAADFSRIPNGVGGIAERMAYVLSEGRRRNIPVERLSEVLSSSAGRFHGFSGAEIEAGSSADLVVWRFDYEYSYAAALGGSRCDHSIYEGLPFTAVPEAVFASGRRVAGNWKLEPSLRAQE